MPCCCRTAEAARAKETSAAGGLSVAHVLRAALDERRAPKPRLPAHHWKVINALLRCHTPALGAHLYVCADCGRRHLVPHSCRNRHCPGCQRHACEQWLAKQSASLLPAPYFHLVFTLPHALNPAISQNRSVLYKLLFDSAAQTLLAFGKAKFDAEIGVTAVLHTWSQTLLDHHHLHCVVTGGGLSLKDGCWVASRADYLFPVKALSKVFRAKYRDGLRQLCSQGKLGFHGSLAPLAQKAAFHALVTSACAGSWVVYSKRPFAGPEAVLAYLSRYTHRVAIGNRRLLALDPEAGRVTFAYKDYADKSRRKRMTLDAREFLRRFCLHILPERFVKIRHYGLLSNRNRRTNIEKARAQLGRTKDKREPAQPSTPPPPPPRCPACGSINLRLIEVLWRCAPGAMFEDSS